MYLCKNKGINFCSIFQVTVYIYTRFANLQKD